MYVSHKIEPILNRKYQLLYQNSCPFFSNKTKDQLWSITRPSGRKRPTSGWSVDPHGLGTPLSLGTPLWVWGPPFRSGDSLYTRPTLHPNFLVIFIIGVHLKGTEKFGGKVINRQLFHRKTDFHMKILSIINFTTKLLSIKDYFLNGPH